MIEFEKFLAPWEHDGDGKALAEPAEIDADKLKKYLYDLQSDKEKLQDDKKDVETELATAKDSLTAMQREKETEAERQARENKERDARYAALEARDRDRQKVEAIEDHFKDKGITGARAKRLAARVSGDDERAWLASADELVEDGFRLTEGKVETPVEEERNLDLEGRPRPVRSDGTPATKATTGKPKTVSEELGDAIPIVSW